MSEQTPPTVAELLDIGAEMAQELQDFAGAQELVDRWEKLYQRSDRYWQKECAEMHLEPTLIDEL